MDILIPRSKNFVVKCQFMLIAQKHTWICRSLAWLLVISSLACWEIAASRFQGCSLGNPDLSSCQPIDLFALGHEGKSLNNVHTDNYQSAQLLALISNGIDIDATVSLHGHEQFKNEWLMHLEAPPTPPPDPIISSLFA